MKTMTMTMALAASLLLAACSTSGDLQMTPTGETHNRFGDSVRQARAQQTIDPDAARKNPDATGIDAVAATHASRRYHNSFKQPQKTFNVLNIGGGVSGSAD